MNQKKQCIENAFTAKSKDIQSTSASLDTGDLNKEIFARKLSNIIWTIFHEIGHALAVLCYLK
jgi:hypothetical protein